MADPTFPDEWLAHSLEGVLSGERLAELRAKATPGRTLWEALVAEKIASDEQILSALSTRFRLKLADVSTIDPKVREGVPEQLARRYRVLPLRITDSYLEVATANPFDLDAEKALAFATAREIRSLLAAPSRIAEKLDEMYRPEKALDKMLQGMEGSADLVLHPEAKPDELVASEAEASQRPVVRLVDLIISEGILSRSSDIHIEPEEGGVAVRYRIDGVLRQVMKIPRAAGLPLISRIKIMSQLDIADRLRPQDGRARVSVNGQPIDLRVSTLPAAQGEKVVIRVLDSRATVKSLDSLGLNPVESEHIRGLLESHEGIILVTGPTGSGKTTTLYSCINQIKSEGVNIVTVEDPVEHRMPGIAQRLMRKLCPTCKQVWMEAPAERLKKWLPKETPLYRAAGCPDCAMTGYRGRFSILEVLTVTPEVERRIAAGETADHIADAARRAGMKTLWESGLAHVLRGESTIDELMRVVDVPQEEGGGPAAAAPAAAPRRSPGVGEMPRGAPSAGYVAPAAEPVVEHFELLEEPAPPRTSGAHGLPARKVLLVDDEDSLRKVIKELLERDGYVVAEARDGAQALDQIDRVGPDVIVLDLNMPRLDGYGVLSHLRSRPATADIPVIVLTAKGDEDNEVRVFELGADDFLTKPFRARALSARLEAVLGRRR